MTLKMEQQPFTSVCDPFPKVIPSPGLGVGMLAAWISGHLSLGLLVRVFRQIFRHGSLTLLAPDDSRFVFGYGAPAVTIRLVDWATVYRLLRDPDMAVGEAYMDGALVVENGTIYDFLDLCLSNTGQSHGYWLRHALALVRYAERRLTQYNPVSRARANVAHHYDLSDDLYALFLDADRQYSCAYYLSQSDSLEQAQEQKKRHLAAKLLLKPGQHILDIGSGWGGLALYLARTAAVDVTGITLSTEQLAYARQRSELEGLTDRVRFKLLDYRLEDGKYDRIVSVGMFEHVGIRHYREYFESVRDLLTDDGVALIHTIGGADGPSAPHPWIYKYIFPGGYTPALSEVVPVIERAGLYITDIEVLRLHYAETLRAWRQRFLANRERVAELYDERFCRMWEFYLAGCEASFRHAGLVVFQIQVSRCIDAVPLSRDYIADWERMSRRWEGQSA
jgi:cyclopropane-fatty-acyl-phospholipid synthase